MNLQMLPERMSCLTGADNLSTVSDEKALIKSVYKDR